MTPSASKFTMEFTGISGDPNMGTTCRNVWRRASQNIIKIRCLEHNYRTL
jgi:hypothetical protein